ncbi:sporulation protein YunB [Syntrophomonas erecta]
MSSSRFNWGLLIIIMSILIVGISFIYIDFRLKASVIDIAKSKAQVSGTEAINHIISDSIVSKVCYQDIVYIHKDNKGKIVLIQPNTIMLNKIMAETVREAAVYLEGMEGKTIEVPVGELTGSKLLAGYGPRLRAKIITAGQVHVKVLNKFEAAGINQTRHLIYFQVDNVLTIAVPFVDEKVYISTTIPLAETIIIGDVPDTYVNFTGERETLYPYISNNK